MSYDPIVDRVVQMKPDGKVVRFIKGHIDSTDEKPTDGIYEGSSLFERDTGKTFNWSEKLNKWVVPDDTPGGSGGGSSGGGSCSFAIFPAFLAFEPLNDDGAETQTVTLSKTWQEIYDLISGGTIVGFAFTFISTELQYESGMHILFPTSMSYDEVNEIYGVFVFDTYTGSKDYNGFIANSPSDYPVQRFLPG